MSVWSNKFRLNNVLAKSQVSLVLLLVSWTLLTSCSTRQVLDNLEGSTEQRLVTHSIDQLIRALPDEPLFKVEGKKLYMKSHFIKRHPLLDYASARLKAEISYRYQTTWVTEETDADFFLEVFFTSLGTDQDSFGLSIPLPVQGDDTEVASLELLSLRMFHGISEMYFYLTEIDSHTVDYVPHQKAQVRTDSVVTPVITLPLNTMD